MADAWYGREILDIARRWMEERDAVVSQDRIATSVFAPPGAERPAHNRFLDPLNACTARLVKALPGDMTPGDWAALSELVANHVSLLVAANPDSLSRNQSRLATPVRTSQPIDPDNPETWDY